MAYDKISLIRFTIANTESIVHSSTLNPKRHPANLSPIVLKHSYAP